MQYSFQKIRGNSKFENYFSKKLFYDHKKIIAKSYFACKRNFLYLQSLTSKTAFKVVPRLMTHPVVTKSCVLVEYLLLFKQFWDLA